MVDVYLNELKYIYSRSEKECEDHNAIGVWDEMGLKDLSIEKSEEGSVEDLGRRLDLVEDRLRAMMEVK